MSTYVSVKPKPKHPGGRPLFDGKPEHVVVSKLEDAFLHGATYKEAALKAGISEKALYRYLEKKEEFRSRIDLLRSNPNLKSKYNIVDKIQEGDVELSIFWLKNQQGSGFNNLDNVQSSTISENQNLDDQGIARIIAICIGRSIAEYESAKQKRVGEVPKDL